LHTSVQYEIPPDAADSINELTDDELDFIEREVFFAFDEAYRQYHQDGIDTKTAIVMYERGLETIRAIRTIKDAVEDEQFEQAKEIHGRMT